MAPKIKKKNKKKKSREKTKQIQDEPIDWNSFETFLLNNNNKKNPYLFQRQSSIKGLLICKFNCVFLSYMCQATK